MTTESGRSTSDTNLTRVLLGCGAVAGPLYLVIGLGQILSRDGFDMTRHALSHLSNGELGWIQIANFLLSGLLVIAGAVGVRGALHPGRGGTWGPILLAVFGLSLIGAGVFVADPAPDFPPGTPTASSGMSREGLLHFVSGALGFYALIAACLVFTRRFAAVKRPLWAGYSLVTGVAFFLIFNGIAAGLPWMLALYAAVAWTLVWHSALSASLLRERTRS